MLLTEFLPQSNVIQTSDIMVKTLINDEITKLSSPSSESKPIDDNSRSITAIKIPLVSFEPILATSSKYILVNEVTKRRNQLVLFNDHLEKFTTRFLINQNILDALWYDKQEYFLILTSTNIYKFDPNIKQIVLLHDLIPIENKTFKCFTLLNHSTLLIAYNEWSAEYIDQWEENNNNNQWQLIKRQPLKLTSNEFIGYIFATPENDSTNIAITIYNHLTEQWRLELRSVQTFLCQKVILLPGSNVMHDYRIISLKNVQSNIKWLVFSSANSNIIAIDSQWKKIQLNYKHPVQRMTLFNKNYLIVRTTEKIDIHLFI